MTHKYSHNIQAFTNEDAVSYYLLGAYITDGCVSKNGVSLTTELKSKDKDWLCSIRDIISPQTQVKKAKRSNCYRLRIANKKIATWLVEHECVPNKSLKVKMPQVPVKYLPDFIRGCIDGDGSIGTFKRTNGTSKKQYATQVCYIVSGSKCFIQEMQEQLKQHNLHSTTRVKRTKGRITILKDGQKIIGKHDQYIIQFTGKYCQDILRYCYYPGVQLFMTRKKNKANEIIGKP
jgi:hypothetical protein